MGGGVGHAATATGRTEAAALTREGDEPVVAAGVAVDPQESVGQHAAGEVRADLALDEAGHGGALRSRAGEEGDELRADDLVEESLLGLMAGVVGDGAISAGTATTWRGERSRNCFVRRLPATRVRASTWAREQWGHRVRTR